MDKLALDVLAAALSLAPLLLVFRWLSYRMLHSKSAAWISLDVLMVLGCAALAVGFFWMWQSLEHPVLAYLDGIVYALLALLAALVPISRWLRTRDTQCVSGTTPVQAFSTPVIPAGSETDARLRQGRPREAARAGRSSPHCDDGTNGSDQ